ncbi:MAG: 50S ribosomal protein L11 methyltransferase [Clostridia bacterium]|nr:50S ribosomal protein L11 methyltransferase [Clostridia bacterium]
MTYWQATVTTTSEFSDTLSVVLMDYGSDGVSVIDSEDIKSVLKAHTWDYADQSLWQANDPTVYVCGYYPESYDFSPLTEKLNELRSMPGLSVGTLELSLKKIDSADYENEWKKYYAPIELDKIVIVPQWIRYVGDKIKVLIDPGMAFGTGNHETTRLCLKFLERLDVAGTRVADIGCGSGILGAAALKLGAEYCLMTDIDPQATDAARRNCALNRVSERADIRLESVPQGENETFSTVVANITADVLISIAESAAKLLVRDGYMITSGIIHSRADEVKAAYEQYFSMIAEECDGEWRAVLWKKR